MKIESIQRKQIKEKKEEEKSQAESELFRDLDEMEHRNQLLMEQKAEAERLNKRKAIVEEANARAQKEKEAITEGKTISATQKMIDKEIYRDKVESSDIWGDDDEIETIPST